MTLTLGDRAFETSTTTGTGTLNLAGPVPGFISFVAAAGTGKKVPYILTQANVAGVITAWETGYGIVTAGTPDTLTRNPRRSSNANAAITLGTGTRNVVLGWVADYTAFRDENLNFIEGFGAIGGLVNAMTLTLPVAPLAYSDGMQIAGYINLTNTTAGATINVNGLGAIPVKINGADPGGGALVAGQLLQGRYKTSTGFFELTSPVAGSVINGQCRLTKSGANILLSPYNGNKIAIGGVSYAVPSAGVTLAPTGLTPSTLYYVYAYMNSGAMTLEASATGHSTDTSTGVEIKTGDATRTLVGMVRPITGPAFQDTAGQRFVVSYFNRRNIRTSNIFTANRTTASTSTVEVNTEIRNEFLNWSDESVMMSISAEVNNTAANANITQLGFDGITPESPSSTSFGNTGVGQAVTAVKDGLSEGYHYATLLGYVSGGTGTWYYASATHTTTLTGLIRG